MLDQKTTWKRIETLFRWSLFWLIVQLNHICLKGAEFALTERRTV